MTLDEKLAQAAASGLQRLAFYQTASGAWDCTARSHERTRVVIGHGVRRTPEAAMHAGLDEFIARATPAAEEDPFA